MAEVNKRKLPAGIQFFSIIRKEGYLYVDKTDLVWQLTHSGDLYNYLSRPRRFGKSLLLDTLQCYFEGKKELFEGLKIMKLEEEWSEHPVIRLDMSGAGATASEIKDYLNLEFSKYEELYGIKTKETSGESVRFQVILDTAYQKTGKQVVVLIDEYDSPLQHSWKTPEHEGCTEVYRSVFSVLKLKGNVLRFVFITGITKFTQISLFSVLNHLTNISFLPQLAPLCGITEEEMTVNFAPELEALADKMECSIEEAHDKLKTYYDGYHFSDENMTDIYNPFSLLNALSQLRLRNYWISSGATSMLNKFVNNMELRLHDFEDCYIDKDTLETSDVIEGGAELFLYQTGYLTIKGFDEDGYSLGFPNEEVRKALYKAVLPALTQKDITDIVSIQSRLMHSMNNGNLEEAKLCMKSLISNVPYSNKKLASMDMEERYRLIISTILNAIGCQVEVEHMLSTGRIDIVASTSRFIYVMELKLANNGGINAAEKQIIDNGYLKPFLADDRKVIGLAVELDDMGKGLIDWKEVK